MSEQGWTTEEVMDALDNALDEAQHAPAGLDRYQLVWGSFWDQLTLGGPIPEREGRP